MLKKIILKLVKISVILIAGVYVLLILLYLIGWQRIGKLLSPLKDPGKALHKGKEFIERSQTVVAVGAHPDDIEWWAGGTLALLNQLGKTVIVVIATDTEGLAEVRRKEQLEAAKILGYDKVIFLGYKDGKLMEASLPDLKSKIKDIIQKASADTMITFDSEFPSYIYRHPDHIRAGQAAIDAAKELSVPKIYLFHTSKPDIAVDITPVIEKKLNAYEAHKSQHQNKQWIRFIFPFLPNLGETAKERLRKQSQMLGDSINVEYAEFFREKI